MNRPPSKVVNTQTGIRTTVTTMRHRWLRMTATIAARATCGDDHGHVGPDEHFDSHQSLVVEECFTHCVARDRTSWCEVVLYEDAAWCEQRDREVQHVVPRTAVEEDE